MGRIAGVSPTETRERLLDAAARVFELKGYEGATVAQIAQEAGVTSGAIYAHYASKAELLVDALRAHRERAIAALFPPGSRTDAASLLITLGSRLGTDEQNATALLAEALLASRRDAALSQVLAATLAEREQLMAGLIADGQAAGDLIEDVSPEVAARFALMLGLGSMLVRTLDLPTADPAEWTDFMRRIVGAFTQETTP
ncbi:MAG TPA: TetR family transcriptional regulator [Acidimicrobiales bacterium]|nr:TetR family transcriptional regulator [Acidimicrobiales bacterium]